MVVLLRGTNWKVCATKGHHILETVLYLTLICSECQRI